MCNTNFPLIDMQIAPTRQARNVPNVKRIKNKQTNKQTTTTKNQQKGPFVNRISRV